MQLKWFPVFRSRLQNQKKNNKSNLITQKAGDTRLFSFKKNMKVGKFKALFSTLQLVIQKNSTLPIIECLAFSDNKITATDLTNYIVVDCEHDLIGCIDFQSLKKVISALDATDEIWFQNNSVEPVNAEILINGDHEFTLLTESIGEFPKTPINSSICLGELTFKSIIEFMKILPFAGTNELQPAMMTICLEEDFMTSTNGHILAMSPLENKLDFPMIEVKDFSKNPLKPNISLKKKETLLIRSKAILILNKIKFEGKIALEKMAPDELRNSEGIQIDHSPENAYVFFIGDGITIISREMDERFPDFKNVIPQDSSGFIEMIVNGPELEKTLKKADSVSNSCNHQVAFKFENLGELNESLKISSDDLDFGHAYSKSIGATYMKHRPETGVMTDFSRIGFNSRLLLQILKSDNKKHLQIKFFAPNKGAIIEDKFLIMPVMLNDFA